MSKRTLVWLAAITGGLLAHAAPPPPLPEVLELVRTHLSGLSTEQLQAPAVDELLAGLGARARLLEDYEEPASPQPAVVATELYEGRFAYLRLGEVGADAATELAQRLTQFQGNPALAGCVLDLRFAGGRDFRVAAEMAGEFLPPGTPVLDWGQGMFRGPATNQLFSHPVAVLVNRQTRGAAEALAATLRQAGVALLIGNATAGEASVFRDFDLTTGQRLRLAVAPVRAGDGEPIPANGLEPDLRVILTPEVERAYLRDPFTLIRSGTNSLTATNSITTSVRVRRRLTEADLVREKNAAGETKATPSLAPAEPVDPKVVRDPVLARGIDFLKGLALARSR
jgi:hypothetical protein